MSRIGTALREWAFPDSIARASIPPFDGGLRPNDLLDQARAVASFDELDIDDVIRDAQGRIVFTAGFSVWILENGQARELADLGGPAGALRNYGDGFLVAVQGAGILSVSGHGVVTTFCIDASVRQCVTDLLVRDDEVIAAIGSTSNTIDGWSRSLLERDASGRLIAISGGTATVIADGLAWPAGLAEDSHGILLSLSLDFRIERRARGSIGSAGTTVLANLPVFPGRIRPGHSGWWVSAPYARNRLTELMMEDSDLTSELVTSLDPEDWPVPRLRKENMYRDPMQLGQLRVLGIVKPWAPPRSYGLVFELSEDGRILSSYQSRVDGNHHGITSSVEAEGELLLASRGARSVLVIERGER